MEREGGEDAFFDVVHFFDDRPLELFVEHRRVDFEAFGHGISSMARDAVNDDVTRIASTMDEKQIRNARDNKRCDNKQ